MYLRPRGDLLTRHAVVRSMPCCCATVTGFAPVCIASRIQFLCCLHGVRVGCGVFAVSRVRACARMSLAALDGSVWLSMSYFFSTVLRGKCAVLPHAPTGVVGGFWSFVKYSELTVINSSGDKGLCLYGVLWAVDVIGLCPSKFLLTEYLRHRRWAILKYPHSFSAAGECGELGNGLFASSRWSSGRAIG